MCETIFSVVLSVGLLQSGFGTFASMPIFGNLPKYVKVGLGTIGLIYLLLNGGNAVDIIDYFISVGSRKTFFE